jgi:hypothetical protein
MRKFSLDESMNQALKKIQTHKTTKKRPKPIYFSLYHKKDSLFWWSEDQLKTTYCEDNQF